MFAKVLSRTLNTTDCPKHQPCTVAFGAARPLFKKIREKQNSENCRAVAPALRRMYYSTEIRKSIHLFFRSHGKTGNSEKIMLHLDGFLVIIT